MPYFCPDKDCDADTYICQLCATVLCSNDQPATWAPIPGRFSWTKGNVCPACAWVLSRPEIAFANKREET